MGHHGRHSVSSSWWEGLAHGKYWTNICWMNEWVCRVLKPWEDVKMLPRNAGWGGWGVRKQLQGRLKAPCCFSGLSTPIPGPGAEQAEDWVWLHLPSQWIPYIPKKLTQKPSQILILMLTYFSPPPQMAQNPTCVDILASVTNMSKLAFLVCHFPQNNSRL